MQVAHETGCVVPEVSRHRTMSRGLMYERISQISSVGNMHWVVMLVERRRTQYCGANINKQLCRVFDVRHPSTIRPTACGLSWLPTPTPPKHAPSFYIPQRAQPRCSCCWLEENGGSPGRKRKENQRNGYSLILPRRSSSQICKSRTDDHSRPCREYIQTLGWQ